MKKYISLLGALLFLWLMAACSQEDSDEMLASSGYLEVNDMQLSCNEEVLSLTRAVDACLQLQLLQEGKVVKEFAPGAPELSKRMSLVPGNYTLKAYTLQQGEAANNEPGNPVGELMHDFTIIAGDLTTLSLIVPQQNIGVKLAVSKEIQTYFPQFSLEISSVSGRKVTLSHATLVSPYYYFTIPTDGKLVYTLTMTNTDGEQHTVTKEITSVLSACNYTIQVGIEEGKVKSYTRLVTE